jgi:hypothetical protein
MSLGRLFYAVARTGKVRKSKMRVVRGRYAYLFVVLSHLSVCERVYAGRGCADRALQFYAK